MSEHAPASRPITRRTVLLGAGTVAAGSFLPGCHRGSTATKINNDAAPMPRYVPRNLVRPDLRGSAGGIEDGFLHFPHTLATATGDMPKSWGTMSSIVLTYSPPAPPMGKNTYWKAVNDKLGGTVTVNNVPVADYTNKVSAVFAGNDLPDTVLMTGDQLSMPNLPGLLNAKFADLSDHLSGDAIKDYPNLAAIPPYSWRSARVNGRIYGIPIQQPPLTNALFARMDLLADAGIEPASIATTDDFLAMCKELSNSSKNKWACSSTGSYLMTFFAAAFGAPNSWLRRKDGTLMKDWESDEFIAALEFHLQLSKMGAVLPDFAGATITDATAAFEAGKTTLCPNGVGAWRGYIEERHEPLSRYGLLRPFGTTAKKSPYFLSPGIFAVTMLTKDDTAKIKQRLKIIDYLAAPFGSTENLLVSYGVKGVDYTLRGSEPVLTDRGLMETKNGFGYIGSPPRVMYSGTSPEWVKAQHAWESATLPHGVADPSVGLYSPTAARNASANQEIEDLIVDVLAGRKSISDFRDRIKQWTSETGDKVAEELQKQLS